MKIKRNYIQILIFIGMLIIPLLFSGCLEKIEPVENDFSKSSNIFPFGKINAPNKHYFGEEIEFDATSSFDPNGRIIAESPMTTLCDDIYIYDNRLFVIDGLCNQRILEYVMVFKE